MIAHKEGTEWVIASASRTGSSRLRTALTQEANRRPKNPVADFIPPWQGGLKEDVQEYNLRIQIARQPIERWNSLFYYFRNVREKPPLADCLDSFASFMDGIVSGNWSHYDCKPFTEHLNEFDPDEVILLRNINELWAMIDAPFFWKTYYWQKSSSHSNSDKKPVEDTLEASPPLSDEANDLISRERELLYQYGAFDE